MVMRRATRCRGFTLVELMIVVAIIGVLAALAIFGVRKHLAAAKSAEATNLIGAISRAAVLAYERERLTSEVLNGSASSVGSAFTLCASAPKPVPELITSVQGKKYQPNTAAGQDFEAGSPTVGWQCLQMGASQPVSYQYRYSQGSGYVGPALGAPDPGADGFEAAAQGDLDGDGTLATFTRAGFHNTSTKFVRLATRIFVHNEFE